MSSRLAFQTQLASIMEVLANAAVAEICKLVDDDYAVVSLQMSQCQRENKALKRKLHLLELKMARGNAERRLRESAMNSSRQRLQINTNERLRDSSPSTDLFDRQMNAALWSGRAAAEDTASELICPDNIQSKSPDVELVEPEAVLVKEEKVEENTSRAEDMPQVGDDGMAKCVPCGSVGRRPSIEQQDGRSTSSQPQSQSQSSKTWHTGSSSRGAEEDDDEQDVVLVKVEDVEQVTGTRNKSGSNIQEGLVESSTDDYKVVLPFDETTQASTNQLSDLESGRGFSESAAPQSTPLTSQESNSIVAVQLRVPDTNTPASPKTQQQRSCNRSSLNAECSLFELETFFTRWAPDNVSVSAPSGPSCSFTTCDSAETDQDGVIIIDSETQPQHGLQLSQGSGSSAMRMIGGQSFFCASDSSRAHIQPQSQETGTSGSMPWRRPAAMIRSAQAPLLQHHHHESNRTSQQQITILSSQTTQSSGIAAVSYTDSSDKSISCISSTSKSVNSAVSLQSAVPGRGTTSAFPNTEGAISAQQQARLLAGHKKGQLASIVPGERRRKGYICRVCGKAFSGLSNLEAHDRVHTGEKPFHCDTCGKRFSEAGNLKKHQRVHTGEKPFSCDQCGKRFAWICNLRTHQQSATGCGPLARGGLGLG
ncbi:uncharacterized protein si:ch211-89o9.6 isoform X2 [Antennarius striatus]|uniref:uncharacterized protein si:ch211-89o9.6 isoform X2 n=1 Tax=Antennarius striatus TaxID=241820 RepID=UPI0035B3F030